MQKPPTPREAVGRRALLSASASTAALAPLAAAAQPAAQGAALDPRQPAAVQLTVNGRDHRVALDGRTVDENAAGAVIASMAATAAATSAPTPKRRLRIGMLLTSTLVFQSRARGAHAGAGHSPVPQVLHRHPEGLP